jgi:hypothetical protein
MGDSFCFTVLIVVIAVWVITVILRSAKRSETKATAKRAYDDYQAALIRLKADPTNADHKQYALQAGRSYSAWTREQKAVTIFDEMALANDIAAATAGATVSRATLASSVEDRMRTLEGLRTKGLVSDAEYAQKRQKLLDEM